MAKAIERLFARFRKTGDPAALAAVFDRTAPEILSVAVHLARDMAAAEDLVQETFVVALRSAESYDASRPLLPWLLGILANRARTQARKDQRAPEPDRLRARAVGDPVRSAEERELAGEAQKAVEKLPSPYRQVLILRLQHGLDAGQIAHALGRAPGTVRVQLHRGMQMLRRALPVGFVLGLAASRGLAAVRAAVLSETSTVAGAVVMSKKTGVLAVVLLLAVATTVTVTTTNLLGGSDDTSTRTDSERRTTPPGKAPAEPTDADAGAAATGASDDEQPVEKIRFAGLVVDEAGKPVAKAQVRIVAPGPRRAADVQKLAAETGPDGRFVFEVEGHARGAQLSAAAPGMLMAKPTVWVPKGTEAHLVLLRGFPVRVRVISAATRAGIGGALVESFFEQWAKGVNLRHITAGHEARTDAEGRATVLVAARPARVVAQADGYAPSIADNLAVSKGGLDVTLELGPGATIVGRVLDPFGTAVNGAKVEARAYPRYQREVVTGADGAFRFENMPPEPAFDPEFGFTGAAVAATARDYPPLVKVLAAPKHGETRTVDLQLSKGRVLTGRVRRHDGSGVPGISVAVYRAEDVARSLWFGSKPVITDEDGRFRVEAVAAGKARVTFRKVAERSGFYRNVDWEIAATGEVEPLEVVIENKGAPLEVRVLTGRGEPVQGARVIGWPAHDLSTRETGTTDAEGRTVLEGLPPRPVVLLVLPKRSAPNAHRTDLTGGAVREVVVRLGAGIVRGRAVRLDGSPAKVEVELVRMIPFGATTYHPEGVKLATDDDGRFQFDHVGGGRHAIEVSGKGFSIVEGPSRVKAGDDVRLVVGTENESGALRFEVELVDPVTNRPLEVRSWPDIRLRRDGKKVWNFFEPVTGSPGVRRARDPVPPGTYDIIVRAQGYRETHFRGARVDAGTTPKRFSIRLEAGAVLVGRVHDHAGKPVGGVQVSVTRQRAMSAKDGRYRIQGLDVGAATVQVKGEHCRPVSRTVTVGAGEPTLLDIEVEVAGALEIALPAGRRPKTGFAVRAVPLTAGEPAELKANDKQVTERLTLWRKASWTLGGLTPGRYRIEGEWDDVAIAAQEVEVEPLTTTNVVIGPR